MDGAKVTTYVTNNGDGTADVKAVMVGNDGNTYIQEYTGINTVDPNDFYFRYTVDGCHLEFDEVLGEEDNSTGWWAAHSQDIKVPAGHTYTTRFKNFTNGANNWNNFLVFLPVRTIVSMPYSAPTTTAGAIATKLVRQVADRATGVHGSLQWTML